jgi:DNA-binding NarL/FixJ family response regulator
MSAPVLIVDDHELVGTSLLLSLRGEGLDAHLSCRGDADGVLRLTSRLAPGVVLLDLDLGRGPDGAAIDGSTLVAHLCRIGWRVIVLSGTTDEPRIGRALDAGALACVPKTSALPVLITAIRRAAQGIDVMRPERRRHLIEQYRRQQEQARAVERRLARLTERERAVLDRIVHGRRAQSIAEEFGVSLATIRTQIRAVLHKLEVGGQLEAVALLNEHRRAVGES